MGSDPKTARQPLYWCVGIGSGQLLQPGYSITSSLKLNQNIGTADVSERCRSEPAAAPGAGSSARLCPGLPCDPPGGPH